MTKKNILLYYKLKIARLILDKFNKIKIQSKNRK